MNLENMSLEELKELEEKLDNDIISQDNRQKAIKIDMNSLFGILGNKYSRWCHYDLALAITSAGQAVSLYTGAYINQKFKDFGFEKDVLIYIDTDSNYYSLEEIVNNYFEGEDPSENDVVEFMDRFSEKKIQPLIDEALLNISRVFNAGERQEQNSFLKMKREVLALSMFLKAKKKYCTLVADSEGYRYDPPDKKPMGLDIIRRETSIFVKENMDTALDLILRDKEEELAQFNKELREKFYNDSLERICNVKPANNLKKWTTHDGSIKTRTPYHIAAALRYNVLLERHNLEAKYDKIKDGEPIFVVYLHTPNPAGLDKIAWPINSELPEEFGLHRYIDWKKMFDKTYMKKVKDFTDILNWRYSDKKKLGSFFNISGK